MALLSTSNKHVIGKMKPLLTIVVEMLSMSRKNPGVAWPPHGPWSGRSLHGPIFRNLAMPRVAVKIEEIKVSRNNKRFLPLMISEFNMSSTNKICTWGGIASIKGSERKLKLRLSKAKPNICFLYPNSRHLFLFLIFCLPLIGFFDQAEVQNPKYTVLWPYLANDKGQGYQFILQVWFGFPPVDKHKDGR